MAYIFKYYLFLFLLCLAICFALELEGDENYGAIGIYGGDQDFLNHCEFWYAINPPFRSSRLCEHAQENLLWVFGTFVIV